MATDKKQPGIDVEFVRELAGVLTKAGLTEIEVDCAGFRVRLAKSVAPPPSPVVHAAPVAAAGALPAPTSAAPSGADAFGTHPGLLTSPMVGVVYLSPEPDAAPFVRTGDSVAVGDTVLLIEAMKVFNPIKAHRAGRIDQIFVSSGMPVEYAEPLLIIV